MIPQTEVEAIAARLLDADAAAASIPRLSLETPGFDLEAAYAVLTEIARCRRAQGWRPVGRKIGFTNTTIWPYYGVDQPMWALIWDRTVHWASEAVDISVGAFAEPRIEPELVFKLARPLAPTDDPRLVLQALEWMAPGFEIVRSPFAGWKFDLAECTAAFGLHGLLVVGEPVQIATRECDALAAALETFELSLRRAGEVVDRGSGSNVLGSPARALAHLADVLTSQPDSAPLAAGEIVTTGTLTDAWPVEAGESWSADFGSLELENLEVRFS